MPPKKKKPTGSQLLPEYALKVGYKARNGESGNLQNMIDALKDPISGGQFGKCKFYASVKDEEADEKHESRHQLRQPNTTSEFELEACFIEWYQNLFDANDGWINSDTDAYRIVARQRGEQLLELEFHAVSPKGVVDPAPGLTLLISDTGVEITQIAAPLLYGLLTQNASCATKGKANAKKAGGKGDGLKSAVVGAFAHFGYYSWVDFEWAAKNAPDKKLDIGYSWINWDPANPFLRRSWSFVLKRHARSQSCVFANIANDKDSECPTPGYPQMKTWVRCGIGGMFEPAMRALTRFQWMYTLERFVSKAPNGAPLTAPDLVGGGTRLVHQNCFRPRPLLPSPNADPTQAPVWPRALPGHHLIAMGIAYDMSFGAHIGGPELVVMIDGRGIRGDTPRVFTGAERTPSGGLITPLLTRIFANLLVWSPTKAQEIDRHNAFYREAFAPLYGEGHSWLLRSATDPLINEFFKKRSPEQLVSIIKCFRRTFLGPMASESVMLPIKDAAAGAFVCSLAPKSVKCVPHNPNANSIIFPVEELCQVEVRVVASGELPVLLGAASDAIKFMFGATTKLLLAEPSPEHEGAAYPFRVNAKFGNSEVRAIVVTVRDPFEIIKQVEQRLGGKTQLEQERLSNVFQYMRAAQGDSPEAKLGWLLDKFGDTAGELSEAQQLQLTAVSADDLVDAANALKREAGGNETKEQAKKRELQFELLEETDTNKRPKPELPKEPTTWVRLSSPSP